MLQILCHLSYKTKFQGDFIQLFKIFWKLFKFLSKNTAEEKLCGISYKIAYFSKSPLMILANASAI